MVLNKLHLENYRCFGQLDINFHPELTVIIGGNGAGKTAILEAAIISLGTLFNPFGELTSTGFSSEHDPRRVVYQVGEQEDVQKQFPVVAQAWGTIEENSIEWSRALASESGRTRVKEAAEILSIGKDYQQRLRDGDITLELPFIAYYGTGRLWDYHKEKSSDIFKTSTRINGYIDCIGGTANLKLMLSWFRKMTVQKSKKNHSGEKTLALDIVYHAMEHCFELASGYKNAEIDYNIDTNELDVSFVECGIKKKLPLSEMSDGYKSTLSLIADMAYRMTVLNPQFEEDVLKKTSGVALIDEIDLHLHPAWQQRILGDLREIFPKVQFIVTTHAPAVINTVEQQHIRILKDNHIYDAPTETYGKDANGVLTAIMEADERPISVKKKFDDFYEAMSKKDYDYAEAVVSELEDLIGDNDPDLTACQVKLDLAQL